MPIIQFTDADRLQSTTMDAGWYKAIVRTIDIKAAKSETSTNFWTEFEITSEGKYKGKELKCCFNTKSNGASVLDGGLYMRPSSDLGLLYAAVNNLVNANGVLDLYQVPDAMDTDNMLVKEFDLKVGLDTTGGALLNIPETFLPAGKATSAGAQQLAF